MNQKKCMQTVSLFLAATVLAGAFTGCRRVKSHKEYVNSEYEFTVKEEPEDNSPDESSSSSSSGGSVITLAGRPAAIQAELSQRESALFLNIPMNFYSPLIPHSTGTSLQRVKR